MIAEFKSFGYSGSDSNLYLSMFFQLRRTFFMIEQEVIGQSPSIMKLKEKIWSSIYTNNLDWYFEYLINTMEDFSTLILGETGVGKTSIARVIGCSGYIPTMNEVESLNTILWRYLDPSIFRSIQGLW